MHYIRLLRPATIDTSDPDNPVLSLLLTITTDLGDSFLYPEDPVQLTFFSTIDQYIRGGASFGKSLLPLDSTRPVLWKPGMRVLNIKLRFDKEAISAKSSLTIAALERDPQLVSLSETRDLLPWRVKEDRRESEGLIADLVVEFDNGRFSASVRRLACQHQREELSRVNLVIEEDIGESIARHIWDAGLVTAALLADSCRTKKKGFCIRDYLPLDKENRNPNVLELGCGVGILGITIAGIIGRAAKQQGVELAIPSVILTDLPEAQTRARSNILRYSGSYATKDIGYENLDWDEGKKSQFGPIVKSRFWDFIVLSDCTYNVDAFPSLVGTLTALHHLNVTNSDPEEKNRVTTKVLLSTKPRHDSEKVLFELLKADGWTYQLKKSIPLPKLNDEEEVVEVYSIEKQVAPAQSSKKRKGADVHSNRSKKPTPTLSNS
ncbi:hypothetical protein MGN70_011093 [Eutypa lata]|nr:hypothetical protein MGN70_011093 [Eutypa lata]